MYVIASPSMAWAGLSNWSGKKQRGSGCNNNSVILLGVGWWSSAVDPHLVYALHLIVGIVGLAQQKRGGGGDAVDKTDVTPLDISVNLEL